MMKPPDEAAPSRVVLDNRSIPCAVGLIKAADRIQDLAPGTVLEIWTRDRFAPMEIPLWAERAGHRVVNRGRVGSWPRKHLVFDVTKDAAASDPA